MQVEERHSYGIIPIIGTPDAFEVLLIEQKDPSILHYWTFAKGTPEAGETPLETAERETREEVGIVCEEIDTAFSFTEIYEFVRGDILIQKSVTLFAGRAPSKDFVVQEKEVNSAKWCSLVEAEELLYFRKSNDVLRALVQSEAPSRLLGHKSV